MSVGTRGAKSQTMVRICDNCSFQEPCRLQSTVKDALHDYRKSDSSLIMAGHGETGKRRGSQALMNHGK